MTTEEWLNTNSGDLTILKGNEILYNNVAGLAQGKGQGDFLVTEYSRDLDNKLLGEYLNFKHSFLLLEPDNMNDFTEEKMRKMGLDTI